MRHTPARPEQTPSPTSEIDIAMKRERALLEQQRAELIRALKAAEQSVKTFPPGSLEQGKARVRVAHLQNALRRIKGKLGVVRNWRDLGEFLIQICRERATRYEWQCIVAEAQRRHETQNSQAL